MSRAYVHGYDERESVRLQDQASSVLELLHADTRYPPGSSVLEAGCGTGAQTVTLARNNPEVRFTSIDISAASLAEAKARVQAAGLTNVTFRQQDVFKLPSESFDHVFVCFLLEHLAHPMEALRRLSALVRPGGSVTVIASTRASPPSTPPSLLPRVLRRRRPRR